MDLKIKNLNILLYMGMMMLVLSFDGNFSGMFLSMHYKPDFALAFDSVNNTLMNEVTYGWLWRKIHAVGSTFFFVQVL